MSDILKPTGLDKKFSYEIEKDGKIYIAGAENCVFSGTNAIFGDMFLEKKRKLFFQ